MSKAPAKIYNFRFDDEFIAMVDEWRGQQAIKPTRTDALKLAMKLMVEADRASRPRQKVSER